jgi:hypothetical protein
MLLSLNKPAEASSGGVNASAATDEDIRSWWAAESAAAGEWYAVELGGAYTVHAVQINFADEGCSILGGRPKASDAYRYFLEWRQATGSSSGGGGSGGGDGGGGGREETAGVARAMENASQAAGTWGSGSVQGTTVSHADLAQLRELLLLPPPALSTVAGSSGAGPSGAAGRSDSLGADGSSARDVLVEIYSSRCLHCAPLGAAVSAAARIFRGEPRLLLRRVDAGAENITSLLRVGLHLVPPSLLLLRAGGAVQAAAAATAIADGSSGGRGGAAIVWPAGQVRSYHGSASDSSARSVVAFVLLHSSFGDLLADAGPLLQWGGSALPAGSQLWFLRKYVLARSVAAEALRSLLAWLAPLVSAEPGEELDHVTLRKGLAFVTYCVFTLLVLKWTWS